eukprot:6666532-Alexandrium_andersonii.AAC.1
MATPLAASDAAASGSDARRRASGTRRNAGPGSRLCFGPRAARACLAPTSESTSPWCARSRTESKLPQLLPRALEHPPLLA